MTTVDLSVPRSGARHRRPASARAARESASALATVCLLTSLGVLVLAVAFRAGREAAPHALTLFWIGEVLLFAPAALWLLRFPCSRAAAEVIAVLVAVTSYATKVAYSPTEFRFPDELQHWRTATDLLASGNLRTPNPALPISPHFPGLELVTSAVAQSTGASLFVSGLVVVGFAHLLTVLMLLFFFRNITDSARVAALAVIVYSANPHFQNFDAMFIYQALGIALLATCMAASARAVIADADAPRWLAMAVGAGVATIATHHISSYALIGFLGVGLIDRVVARDRAGARRLGLVLGVTAAAALVWALVVAPDTSQYFQPVAEQLANNVTGLLGGGGGGASPPPQNGSRIDQLLAYASVALLLLAAVWGWWVVRRNPVRPAWLTGIAVAAGSFLLALAVRVVSSDGAELYGRAMSFVFIPLSVVAAIGALALAARCEPVLGRLVIALMLVVIFVGGIMTGWPPAWERVPGHYQVSAYESSVEPQGVSAAQWAGRYLPPGTNIAADFTNNTLFGTYGRQNAIRQVAPLYLGRTFTPAARSLVSELTIRYLVSDARLATQLPASGSYFPLDPNSYRYKHPLPLADLRKFDHVPGASRVYDGGAIVVYDLRGVTHGS
jgi:hypothetical protein